MRDPERHMSRLILCGKAAHSSRYGVRSVSFKKPEEREKRALSQYREQKRGGSEVRLLDQCLQRCLAACGRDSRLTSFQQCTTGEHLNVTGFVGCLNCKQLHHFTEVRMKL